MINNISFQRIKRLTRKFLYNTATRAVPGLDIVSMEREVEEMGRVYERCKNITTSSKTRIYALYKAVEYIVTAGIPGDFVECGVFRGGSCMVMALTLLKMKETGRKIYLYDTYEGMPPPTKEDVFISSGEAALDIYKRERVGKYSNICRSSLEEVKRNMYSTGYPEKNLVFIKGKVQDTVPGIYSGRISLLSLDTDWYESTMHELTYFFPLLVKKGILLIDDYGTWKGQKKAVDKYIMDNKIKIMLNRIDQAGRIGVKTG